MITEIKVNKINIPTGGKLVKLVIVSDGKVYEHRYYTATKKVILSDCPAEVLEAARAVAYTDKKWSAYFKPTTRKNSRPSQPETFENMPVTEQENELLRRNQPRWSEENPY